MRSLASLAGITLLGALGTALCGCGGGPGQGEVAGASGPDVTKPSAVYFPLAVGNSWTIRVTTYTSGAADLNSPETGADGALSYTSSFTITGTKTMDGAKWFVGGYTPPIPSQEPWYGRHTATGMLVQITNAGTPYYLLKAPIKVGTAWDLPSIGAKRKITKVGATTTVPAGTFHNCIKVEQTYTAPDMAGVVVTYWFANGTGIVRTEIRRTGVLETKMVLTKYTVK